MKAGCLWRNSKRGSLGSDWFRLELHDEEADGGGGPGLQAEAPRGRCPVTPAADWISAF